VSNSSNWGRIVVPSFCLLHTCFWPYRSTTIYIEVPVFRMGTADSICKCMYISFERGKGRSSKYGISIIKVIACFVEVD
jgi:hypothetical protein